MGDTENSFFLHPRPTLTAASVPVWDAINLVLYAKIPRADTHRGKELVAGFVTLDHSGREGSLLSTHQRENLLREHEAKLAGLIYPVGPDQYEPIIEEMRQANALALPYFVHEHHVLVDRRRRVTLFAELHKAMAEDVASGRLILQSTESERATQLSPHAWMTQETLKQYLSQQGVAPFWSDQGNLQRHERVEQIIFSDIFQAKKDVVGWLEYDLEQLPSYVFALKLSKRFSGTRFFGEQKPQNSLGPKPVIRETATPTISARSSSGTKSKPVEPEAVQSATFGNEDASAYVSSSVAPTASQPLAADEFAPGDVQVDKMLSKKEAADLVGMSTSSFDNYRKKFSDFPQPVTYGPNTVRWKRSDVMRWIETRGKR